MNPVVAALALGGAVGWGLSRLLQRGFEMGNKNMVNCSDDLLAFHDDEVWIGKATRDDLRGKRDANRRRVERGLSDRELPAPVEFVRQGSHAMYTLVKLPDGNHDIDDGVVLAEGALVGARGGELSPLNVRKLVRDCVHSEAFNTPPEVKTMCVRVFYNEGYHVDIPVYREVSGDGTGSGLEIAGPQWEATDPRGVTEWFNEAVKARSPDTTTGRQMRRVVRYLKKFAVSRKSWNMPSGFVLSVLVDESYQAFENRDDVALYESMRAIHDRLKSNLVVNHPVLTGTTITKTAEDANMVGLRDKLGEALTKLQVLHETDCTLKSALGAWDDVFGTKYFAERLDDAATLTVSGGEPTAPVQKRGSRRFGSNRLG